MHIPCIYVHNNIDQISIEELDMIYRIDHCVPISAEEGWNYDEVLDTVSCYLISTKTNWLVCEFSTSFTVHVARPA